MLKQILSSVWVLFKNKFKKYMEKLCSLIQETNVAKTVDLNGNKYKLCIFRGNLYMFQFVLLQFNNISVVVYIRPPLLTKCLKTNLSLSFRCSMLCKYHSVTKINILIVGTLILQVYNITIKGGFNVIGSKRFSCHFHL